MRHHLLTTTLFCFLIFSCSSFAIPLNGSVQQSLEVYNESSQAILVTDNTSSTVSDLLFLDPHNKCWDSYTFSADQFTTLPEQMFSRTVTILSAEGNKPICTVTTHITVSLTSLNVEEPTNSDPLKCEAVTTSSSAFSKKAQYQYYITVK